MTTQNREMNMEEQLIQMDKVGIIAANKGDSKLQRELFSKIKSITAFKYDGLLIEGEICEIVTRYCRLNPSKKFRTWLIDENLVMFYF